MGTTYRTTRSLSTHAQLLESKESTTLKLGCLSRVLVGKAKLTDLCHLHPGRSKSVPRS